MSDQINRYLKTFGPGILFASTAIGVSHLVQSTRAGAEFGFELVIFVVLANLLKYPFFEFSSRYSNVTGTSIIDGYLRLGRHFLVLYLLITVASMFFVTAAVGFVTAGFFENLLQIEFLGIWTVVILFAICAAILVIGRYSILDSLIKIVGAVLIVSTLLAFAVALWNGPAESMPDFEPPELLTHAGLFFLIALMGWMPVPVDISSWHSLWTLERIRQTGFRPRLRDTLLDFNLAYVITAALAVVFVVLGAYIFFGTGEELPNNSSLFAGKIVSLYTATIGDWSGLIISASAFSVMFGTIIAVFDGYSRSLARSVRLLSEDDPGTADLSRKKHALFISVLAAGSLLVLVQFGDRLKELVDFATTVSFLIAPIIAVFNFRLVTGRYVERGMQPPAWLRVLACAGVAFLVCFAAIFALLRLGLL